MSEIKSGDRVKTTTDYLPFHACGDCGVVVSVEQDGTSLVRFDEAYLNETWYTNTKDLVRLEDSLKDEFDTWLALNPKFWEMFVLFTNQLMACGATKSSAWLVCNRIRWETALKTQGNPYKKSNDLIAMLPVTLRLHYSPRSQ